MEIEVYHEIAFRKTQLLRQAFFCSILSGTLNLVVIVVQTNNVDPSEFSNLSRWSSNATSYVKYLHAISQAHDMSKVVLMTSNGLVKAFAVREAAEVERATPTIFVNVCREVVVVSSKGCIFCFTCLGRSVRYHNPLEGAQSLPL